MMDAQHFPFYIILSNYVCSILFHKNKNHNVRRIRFHFCIKIHRWKRRVCKGKTLFGQPSTKRITWFFEIIIHNKSYCTGNRVIIRQTESQKDVDESLVRVFHLELGTADKPCSDKYKGRRAHQRFARCRPPRRARVLFWNLNSC